MPSQLPASLPRRLESKRNACRDGVRALFRSWRWLVYFQGNDCTATLFEEWGAFLETPFEYKKGESLDRVIHQGVHLLQKFVQDDRVRIHHPESDLQVKLARDLPGNNEFVAYIDALGRTRWQAVLDRLEDYDESLLGRADGLLSLDPQLICYSWISGISDVALVVFVRKNHPEIQYLKAAITEGQRREYGRLVETTVGQIEAGQFPPHSGIRFPQNGCMSCPHLGLCLGNQELISTNLIRKPGASDLDWLDELVD